MSKSFIDNHLAGKVLARLGNHRPTPDQFKLVDSLLLSTIVQHRMVFHEALTGREVNCLLLAAKGKTMKEVAKILHVKYSTVVTRYKSIKRKLNSQSMAQAVFEGIRYGYMAPLYVVE